MTFFQIADFNSNASSCWTKSTNCVVEGTIDFSGLNWCAINGNAVATLNSDFAQLKFLYWRGVDSSVDPRKRLFLTIQRVYFRTCLVPINVFSTKHFSPAWMVKFLFRLSKYGSTPGLCVKTLSILTLTASDKTTLVTNWEALSMISALDVWSTRLMSAVGHVLDCTIAWRSLKVQLGCNTWQQKPFTIQGVCMWCSIQLENEMFALSELVQPFQIYSIVCLAVRSLLITLTRGPRKCNCNVCGPIGSDGCWVVIVVFATRNQLSLQKHLYLLEQKL